MPSVDQFEAIVADIRGQAASPHAQVTGDFVEFLGLTGLGQAEASSLTWGDVDWTNRCPRRRAALAVCCNEAQRKKTDRGPPALARRTARFLAQFNSCVV